MEKIHFWKKLYGSVRGGEEKEKQLPPGVFLAEKGIPWILMLLLPIAAFYLMEAYEHNPFVEVRKLAQWYNIFIFELLAWILFFVTGRAKWALRIEWLAAMLFGLINHYVMEFRSTPFVPWDIYSVRTAMSVAGNYDFIPSMRVGVVTIIFLVGIVLFHFLELRLYGGKSGRFLRKNRMNASGKPEQKENGKQGFGFVWMWRFLPAALLLGILAVFVNTLQDEDFQTSHYLYPFLFTPAYMTKVNGMAVTFAMDLAYVVVDKPSDYSKAEAQEILEEYAAEAESVVADTDLEDLPNIIVIMNEAFSDLAVLGDQLTTNTDYMPYFHSLQLGQENTITGMLNVSVCGGNTANTEFEFLTGNTMAFFPTGSIPYQQYVKSETSSLASHLKYLGYATYAVHPYNASGWNREDVYPLLGFERFDSLRTFINPGYVRTYVSDESDFNKVISLYESKPDGQPAFIFNVTMQNHGSYTEAYENFTPDVTTNTGTSFALQQYLSLIKLSDQELEKLIAYFAEQDEKTIVVFFGDHQPADVVARPVWAVNGVDDQNLTAEQEQLRYQVPYVIWANYEIDSATGQDTSANYLAAEVLEAGGVPLSDYQTYLMDLKEDFPIISAIRQEAASEEADLSTYQKLQYYQMFDR